MSTSVKAAASMGNDVHLLCYGDLSTEDLVSRRAKIVAVVNEITSMFWNDRTTVGEELGDYAKTEEGRALVYNLFNKGESIGSVPDTLDTSKVPVHCLLANPVSNRAVLIAPLHASPELYVMYYVQEAMFGKTSHGELRLMGGQALAQGIFQEHHTVLSGAALVSFLMYGTPAYHSKVQKQVSH